VIYQATTIPFTAQQKDAGNPRALKLVIARNSGCADEV
jgi:hypothetical protein